jgi:hypothetical protein
MAAFFTNKYLEMAKECIPTKIDVDDIKDGD